LYYKYGKSGGRTIKLCQHSRRFYYDPNRALIAHLSNRDFIVKSFYFDYDVIHTVIVQYNVFSTLLIDKLGKRKKNTSKLPFFHQSLLKLFKKNFCIRLTNKKTNTNKRRKYEVMRK